MFNTSKKQLWTGIVLILIVGAIHVYDAPDSFGDATYKGWLFYANGLAAVIAALAICKEQAWGWILGFMVSGGAFVGYVASRTIGLPMIPPEPQNWLEPLGVVSLITEAAYVFLFVKIVIGKK